VSPRVRLDRASDGRAAPLGSDRVFDALATTGLLVGCPTPERCQLAPQFLVLALELSHAAPLCDEVLSQTAQRAADLFWVDISHF